ncbi:anti-sigma regulatory factor [Prauserella marina]|uniref:Anti-sigma regulatory factor (Ser/Thr protein kinase) n=1 Tax=Prauserella marina TaxID=530584 RepID=A0A222VM96_9PSEU|nr:sensor histidine kinase [Prauserella marina]ASR35049.1 anti-sigma regulatory factor [Prauserella marina]PWV85211.1 anti-sigma regulatory factor (Ser/Thr protein kinase) [Prauserella marina]SDC02269.1 Anti-sigma regulatory factor (Ser/Thr protein kinase) [Prauserella marina]
MKAIRDLSAGAFEHPALLYRDEESYLAGTVPFVRAGVAANEPVAVAVPGPKGTSIASALGLAARRVTWIDMRQAGRNPARIIAGVLRDFADSCGDRPVRIIGEPVWAGRTDSEYPACAQHEALINAAFAGRGATILCPYDVSALSAAVLADAERTHPVLVEDGIRRQSAGYAPDEVVSRYNLPLEVHPYAASMQFDLGSLGKARHFAVAAGGEAGLAGDVLDDLALAVGELTANSVQHGGGTGLLSVWRDDGQLVIQVADAGRLADPLAGRRSASGHQRGGRGLLLVNHVADLVRTHVTERGTTTRAYFRLP